MVLITKFGCIITQRNKISAFCTLYQANIPIYDGSLKTNKQFIEITQNSIKTNLQFFFTTIKKTQEL